jgi:S-adenosylmethionine-diacylgycerolhomoserine-N-methlytransferase
MGICSARGVAVEKMQSIEPVLKNAHSVENSAALSGYYRLHAPIYDSTRWAFLFGRTRLIGTLASKLTGKSPASILEVGCGTGKNIIALARAFPDAKIIGCDLSKDMLTQARTSLARSLSEAEVAKVELINSSILSLNDQQYDLIVCSYMLSMTGDSLEPILHSIRRRLSPNGALAIVDFDYSGLGFFRRWMRVNHVSLDGSLSRALTMFAKVEHKESHRAFGLWRWLLWIGK